MDKEHDPKSKELKKHVAIIHCANSFSLMQRKISNALLYHAFPKLTEIEEHQITIKQLCSIIGYSGFNYAAIKEALRQLIATVIEWNITDENGEEDWSASSILASVQLKGAVCNYAYSPRLRRLLANPRMYGKINLAIQARFSSSYGLALYENCVRFIRLPYTKWFDLDTFRKIMGVPKEKYEIFRDFKKRVIDKAVEEVNTHSDMLVEPEYNKINRQVVSIRFKVSEKQNFQVPVIEQGRGVGEFVQDADLVELLVKTYKLTSKQAIQLYEEYGPYKIQEKIAFIESSPSYKNGKIKNIVAYLTSALRHDYQSQDFIQYKQEIDRGGQLTEELINQNKVRLVELKKQQQDLFIKSAKNISIKEKVLIHDQIKQLSEQIATLEMRVI